MMSAAALCSLMCLFFFASSGHPRALHSFPTRRSSDLERAPPPMVAFASQTSTEHPARASVIAAAITLARAGCSVLVCEANATIGGGARSRSEERRVGKECRARGWPEDAKKNRHMSEQSAAADIIYSTVV